VGDGDGVAEAFAFAAGVAFAAFVGAFVVVVAQPDAMTISATSNVA
jgi:hypothetical protein